MKFNKKTNFNKKINFNNKTIKMIIKQIILIIKTKIILKYIIKN